MPHHRAALVTLSLRLLATGATIVVAGSVFLALRDEIREAYQEAEQEADGHDAACAQGAHEPASTTEQARGHVAK